MRNYKHELLNSRTQRYFSKGLRNSTLKGLKLEDTTSWTHVYDSSHSLTYFLRT
ncbi:hypothetical protein MTR67_021877 [Solanum verrucosum]|uniref:Uncharacterized protein n=1 Tax=Solanum verrucosum TaxID=315347 RepID=A0AAF0TQ10_SOLVR|nr:hypothetical protein MTR67_021877 [Solanum verrucosum]